MLQNIITSALLTRLDLYYSELALASSPVYSETYVSNRKYEFPFVICGLAAVVGQASKAPPPLPPFNFSNEITPLSSYVAAASCARALSAPLYPPPPLPVSPLLTMLIT